MDLVGETSGVLSIELLLYYLLDGLLAGDAISIYESLSSNKVASDAII